MKFDAQPRDRDRVAEHSQRNQLHKAKGTAVTAHFPGTLFHIMDNNKFLALLGKARRHYYIGLRADYWHGYQRGL